MANALLLRIEGNPVANTYRAVVRVTGYVGHAEFEVPGAAVWTRGPWRPHQRTEKGLRRLVRRLAGVAGLVPGGLHPVEIERCEVST